MKPVYQEEASSCFTHDGVLYSLNTVLRLVPEYPVVTVRVGELAWSVNPPTEDEKTRAEQTDLKHPVLVANFGERLVTVDGYHRLIKAIQEGVETLPARMVSEEVLLLARIP